MDEAALYVLAAPIPGTRTPAYLLYEVGGLDCVLAYTDRKHLVECCGEYQPWIGIQVPALMTDLRDQRLVGPAINMPLSPAVRWTADGPPPGPGRFAAAAPAADEGAAATPAAAPGTGQETAAVHEAAAVREEAPGPGEVTTAARKEWWR